MVSCPRLHRIGPMPRRPNHPRTRTVAASWMTLARVMRCRGRRGGAASAQFRIRGPHPCRAAPQAGSFPPPAQATPGQWPRRVHPPRPCAPAHGCLPLIPAPKDCGVDRPHGRGRWPPLAHDRPTSLGPRWRAPQGATGPSPGARPHTPMGWLTLSRTRGLTPERRWGNHPAPAAYLKEPGRATRRSRLPTVGQMEPTAPLNALLHGALRLPTACAQGHPAPPLRNHRMGNGHPA